MITMIDSQDLSKKQNNKYQQHENSLYCTYIYTCVEQS